MSKKCTPLWREAHLQVKMYKAPGSRTTFGSYDVEKVHAVVALSTFRSENAQNTPWSDHFWKLRCRKSARRCGAKHISKSKCTKHTMYGPLLEDVEKVHAVVARSTFRSQNVQSTPCTDHFWRFRCARDCGPCQKWAKREGFVAFSTTTHCTPIHYTTLQLHLHLHSTFYYTTLHYTTLHSITLNYTTLHYTTLHYTTLHYTTLHSTTLQLQLHYTPLHSTTLNYTALHYTTLHSTTLQLQLHKITLHLHYTPLHYTTFHYTPLHYTTLHYTTSHWMTLHHR